MVALRFSYGRFGVFFTMVRFVEPDVPSDSDEIRIVPPERHTRPLGRTHYRMSYALQVRT